MVLHLAEQLDVPLRERNALLLAAGYAPEFVERPLDDPALASARAAVVRLLEGHEPYPAIALDRHWNIVAANKASAFLLTLIAPHLREPPVNVLRASLHPEGLASSIVNLTEWRAHLVARLRRAIATSGDPELVALQEELQSYPAPGAIAGAREPARHEMVIVPLRIATPAGTLSLISTSMVFGTPVDITLSELAIETFFPADRETAQSLRQLAELSDLTTANAPVG
jgi:hypothetical protein